PLIGDPFPEPAIPGPEVFDLRSASAPLIPSPFRLAEAEAEGFEAVGSNNWAVAASYASGGHALVANDMHLGLSVPNTWYRATLIWRSGDDAQADKWISGVTLPGTPAVSVGSNRHVAWGFTNSMGDWNDLVVIEPDPADRNRYLTPDGPRPFERHRERIL